MRGRPLAFVLVALSLLGAALLVVGVVQVLDDDDPAEADVVVPAGSDVDAPAGSDAAGIAGFGVEPAPVPADAVPEFARAFTQVRIAIGAVEGGPCVDLLVADTPERRNQGLRGVADLGEWDGMLFVRPEPAQSSFTMSRTAMDLTIGWYDGDGALLGTADMVVCAGDDATCPTYPSPGPWTYAVEYPIGTLPPGDLSRC